MPKLLVTLTQILKIWIMSKSVGFQSREFFTLSINKFVLINSFLTSVKNTQVLSSYHIQYRNANRVYKRFS